MAGALESVRSGDAVGLPVKQARGRLAGEAQGLQGRWTTPPEAR
eukprot:CAMPEP_0206025028 /NCGR_PEP_ID=MMETSP1464-20131121/39306_1 /ASSEMBLY_ACC=CAM_ASM_001124 /TAXON_ID=119497 /ORGANISM="Exanthemachrysis gayraliae, Strain RCC1523" /LENGTH=43 /DNA_ID= /DNA_START= /DNA_END= /DNA_ORIENTATION=